MKRIIAPAIAFLLLLATASAQTVEDAGTPVQTQPSSGPDQEGSPVVEPHGFDYEAAGRRDPFVSLLGRGSSAEPASGSRIAGLAGLDTSEVALTGTLQTGNGSVAMLEGVDGRTYIVRPGDRLRDGSVRAITQNALVILQEVVDPLSQVGQREVRKTIRQTNEAN